MKIENFWTSKKPISGLRHFVLVNKINEDGNTNCLLVSVLDSEINLEITYSNLLDSNNWEKGWLNLPKAESITKDYVRFKSKNKKKDFNKIFLIDNSLFNIF